MSSNRMLLLRAVALTFTSAALALSLSACASDSAKFANQARTPTELYTLQADKHADQVMLAVHNDGLSPAQDEALRGLAQRWRDGGGDAIRISAPHGQIDSYGVYKTVQAARTRLIALGVPEGRISQQAYEAGADAKPPVMIEFTTFEAVVPACGTHWDNLTATKDNTGRVSVDFKPYGVGLGFTPLVMSGGLISLKVSTEVSELTSQGSFTLGTGSTGTTGSTSAPTASAGLTIPALKVRRAETTVELPSGGAMMIAGLLQQETQQDLDSLPGLMDMPVLGALFRSRDYLSGETELVVIVTPYLVKPTSPDKLQTPVDGLQTASDLETTLLGKINKTYKTPPAAVAGKTYQGPYGYVIE